ncbi:MAG: toll/interleukin-1 receptor domain-containing protein [Kineosporiaceae bacterium]
MPGGATGYRSRSIFISYRRSDAAGHAGRVYDRLVERFGRESVFMDVSAMVPGEDVREQITGELRNCDVLIALIGPDWSGPGSNGLARLDDSSDVVRLELETALSSGAQVIPVLVRGAAVPPEDQLPESLRPIVRRHALGLDDARWDHDIGRLMEVVARHVKPPGLARTRLPRIGLAVVATVVLGLGAFLVLRAAGLGVGSAPGSSGASSTVSSSVSSVPSASSVPSGSTSVSSASAGAPAEVARLRTLFLFARPNCPDTTGRFTTAEGQIAKIGCNDDQLGVRADFVSWSSQASMNAFANVLRARYSGVVEQNWSLRGDGVITGYTLEYRDESGQATIFWTYNSDTVSGHASWKDDDQTALNAWWKATGARLRS